MNILKALVTFIVTLTAPIWIFPLLFGFMFWSGAKAMHEILWGKTWTSSK